MLAADALDIVPYWFTKLDAEKAGPILECRLTLAQRAENGNEQRMGVRALASGRKIIAPQAPRPIVVGIQFDVTDPALFQRDCASSGCTENFKDLCEKPQIIDGEENLDLLASHASLFPHPLTLTWRAVLDK